MICRYVANVWMDRPLSCVPCLLYSDLVWLSMSIWPSVWAGEEAGWLAFPWGATKRKAPVCSSACMFLAHCGSAAPPLPRLHCFVPLCCLLSPLFSALHGCQSPAVASIGVSGPHVSLFVNFFHRISWMHYSIVYWREAIDPVTLDFPNKSCNHLISIGDLLKACLSLLTSMKG